MSEHITSHPAAASPSPVNRRRRDPPTSDEVLAAIERQPADHLGLSRMFMTRLSSERDSGINHRWFVVVRRLAADGYIELSGGKYGDSFARLTVLGRQRLDAERGAGQ